MPTKQGVANRMIALVSDDTHGYDQSRRWGPDYDCSSSVYEVCIEEGYDLPRDGTRYTGSMIEHFRNAGAQIFVWDGNMSDLEPGDIMLNEQSHTEVYVGNGQLAGFNINEHGGISGGQPGDQTGREAFIKPFYDFPWTHVISLPDIGDDVKPTPRGAGMKGIDVSSHDQEPFKPHTEACYRDADFVIAKATQSTYYINPTFEYSINRAAADGKLLGVYHYAGGSNAAEEARFFFDHVKPWIGRALPALDWESYENNDWGNAGWCRAFADEFHRLSGVWPAIYIQASALWQAASCAGFCPLWIAGYPGWAGDNWNVQPSQFPYDTGAWDDWTIWQYTSDGGTDRNVSNIDSETWLRLAGAKEEEDEVKPEDINAIARAVWTFIVKDVQARDRLFGMDSIQLPAIQAQLTAQSAAIKALAEAKGADPEKIAEAVQAAVTDALEKIELDVRVNN